MRAKILTSNKMLVIVPFIEGDKWDGKHWITLTDIVFVIDDETHIIKAGFVTDFGSIPWLLSGWIKPIGIGALPFVVHDLLYKKGFKYNQSQSDDALYILCRLADMSWSKSQTIRLGLRIGGSANFRKSHPRFERVDPAVIRNICQSNNYQQEQEIA